MTSESMKGNVENFPWNVLEPSLRIENKIGTRAVYWRDSPGFIDELANELNGMRVLEVFAGNGLLAALLAERGISITATTKVLEPSRP